MQELLKTLCYTGQCSGRTQGLGGTQHQEAGPRAERWGIGGDKL